MKTQMTMGTLLAGILTAAQALATPVNINTADAAAIAQALAGVGPTISQEIVAYRQENGPFKAPEDLLKVDGIGPKTFASNKDDILIGD